MTDNWYSTGVEEAEKMAASNTTRRHRNFFTKDGETARIRFLKPSSDSFNYKRSFVKWAKGQKLLTSPQTVPDPFVEAGLQLQAAFAWPIVDRRKFEFEDQTTGEKKEVGPRILFFADGQRTRKQLIAFEKEMLAARNEELEEEGKEPLTLEDYNLTSYDIRASKPKGAPWNFVAMGAKPLTKEDKQMVKEAEIDLSTHEWIAGELKPLPQAELNMLLKGNSSNGNSESNGDGGGESYSYSDDDDDTVSFDD